MRGDQWLEELVALRRGGIARSFRARIREAWRYPWELSGGFLRPRTLDHVDVLLYPETAGPGDLPLVVVPVAVDAPTGGIGWGDVVEARGLPEPGHALVIMMGDEWVPCAGPATVPPLFRRPYRL